MTKRKSLELKKKTRKAEASKSFGSIFLCRKTKITTPKGDLFTDENYSSHICNATVLLGFAHFEDFLGKCIKRILIDRPDLNKYKFDYKAYNENCSNLIGFIATEQIRRLNVSEMLRFVRANVAAINEDLTTKLDNFRKLRNCLIHNNGIADENLGFWNLEPGNHIVLSAGQLHGAGLVLRQYARTLWENLPTEK